MPSDGPNKKLYFDGDLLYIDINLGDMIYYNVENGAKEIYTANKISFHFPSEHYITQHNQTPRYALEIQIWHKSKETNNLLSTNEKSKVEQAAVSILFTQGDLEEGDMFLNELGISKYNIDDEKKFNIPSPKSEITRKKNLPASFDVGMNYLAFQGLLDLLNADRHLYFYYGSETTPPCNENVLWIVYANPRSISVSQLNFLLLTLAKNKNQDQKNTQANSPEQLQGNKRAVQDYDDDESARGKIKSNSIGVKYVKNNQFFKDTDNITEG